MIPKLLSILAFTIVVAVHKSEGSVAWWNDEVQNCKFETGSFASVPAASLEECTDRCRMMENCAAFNWNGVKCDVTDQKMTKSDANVADDNKTTFCGVMDPLKVRGFLGKNSFNKGHV